MKRTFNPLLLLLSLVGGAVGFIAGEIMLRELSDTLPRFVLIGLYFGVMALSIGLFSLIAELSSPRLNGNSWRQRYTGLSWKLLVPATLVLLFVAGGAMQLVYGLDLGSVKPVKDIVLVIDNSGSMLETDPNDERYTAAKQLVDKMDADKRAAVVVFNSKAQLVQPFVAVDSQARKDEINAVIDSLAAPDGGTDFAGALSETMREIDANTSADRGTMIILLSDGFSESGVNEQIEAYRNKRIAVNTVGLSVSDERGLALLRQMAKATGGSYSDVSDANQLPVVLQTIYKALDDRTLVTERIGVVEDSMLYAVLRVISLLLIGAALGVSLGLMFDNRFLALSFGSGGAVGGVLAGLILEAGLSGRPFPDSMSRLAAALVLAAVIALFTLVVPVREHHQVTRRSRDAGRPAAPGVTERARDTRSRGF
ncbi:VWA domain-containing protein [Paenibacillaceae bacterium]|nr:VWA domain-containing protein [Paenibacillaceae bacterium]